MKEPWPRHMCRLHQLFIDLSKSFRTVVEEVQKFIREEDDWGHEYTNEKTDSEGFLVHETDILLFSITKI